MPVVEDVHFNLEGINLHRHWFLSLWTPYQRISIDVCWVSQCVQTLGNKRKNQRTIGCWEVI